MWDFLMWMYNFSRYILVGLNSCYWSSIYFTCLFHTFCIFWLDIGISIPSNFAHTKVKLLPSFVEYYMFICIRNVSFFEHPVYFNARCITCNKVNKNLDSLQLQSFLLPFLSGMCFSRTPCIFSPNICTCNKVNNNPLVKNLSYLLVNNFQL